MYDFVDDNPKPAQPKPETQAEDLCVERDLTCEPVADLAFVPPRHVSEFSISLHGKNHPEALFRAAGGLPVDRSLARPRVIYRCPCCGQTANRVIRVRASRKSAWSGVCAMCAASLLAKNPEAVIGGRVRPSSRRGRRFRDAG